MQRRFVLLTVSVCALSMVGHGVSWADPPAPPPSQIWFPWSIPSDTGHYVGYYVGGGCGRPHKAEPRASDEGTWGWDYQGWLFPRRVVLGWWHGRRDQGGAGAYQTDGPKLYHPEKEAGK